MRQFLSDTRGNVVMIGAIVLIPLLMVLGIAFDLQRAENAELAVQNALDAATLATARSYAESNDAEAAVRYGLSVFNSDVKTMDRSVNCEFPVLSIDETNKLVSGTAKCVSPVTFAAIMNDDGVNVSTATNVVFGDTKIELALMLDVSGSMSGQKLIDLQGAADELIDTLIPVRNTGNVRISLAPYSTSVNAGIYGDVSTGISDLYAHTVSNLGADPDNLINAFIENAGGGHESFDVINNNGVTGLSGLGSGFLTCEPIVGSEQTTCSSWNVGESTCNVHNRTVISGFPVEICTDRVGSQATGYSCNEWTNLTEEPACGASSSNATTMATNWQGLDWTDASLAYVDYDFNVLGEASAENIGQANCVSERDGAQMFTNAPATKFPMTARASFCPSVGVEPLTADTKLLHDAVGKMKANGLTAGHLGIGWSWYTLSESWSPVWPFSRRAEPHKKVRKIAILMTDGAFNTYYVNENGNSDTQSRGMCKAMKEDQIEIFSVAFAAPPSGQAILKQCATSKAHYFEASNGAELKAAYAEITSSVNNIRISD